MLETKNLVKIYKPKKGVPVRALNNVSLKFPDAGMVFLLGKSGSGKSTLLNILGGLDRYNSGDILIKGKSSRSFRQRHFDSYRNTYVGFIFQEYNILDEFSVGVNIGLALQLQGLKPTSEQINAILKEVDLEGYGNRKPNELSGGQKQSVAIARALVKNPKIIMADEPTGALDSVTGRQVLQTLKKLSQNKLVIVVSHDREFAEQYADRIIELSDGSVIRDVARIGDALPEADAPVYQDDAVVFPKDYVLTDEDKQTICQYIQRMIDCGQAPKMALGGTASERVGFKPTDTGAIKNTQDGYKLIKSRLPMKYAFKMGASGLKHKKFRLIMTILLSCVAFVLFGLADTFASYDYVTTSVSSLTDPESQIRYVAFEKSYGFQYENDNQIYWQGNQAFTDEDLEYIEDETGLTVYPVLTQNWKSDHSINISFGEHLGNIDYNNPFMSPFTSFSGLVEAKSTLLSDMNAELIAGKLPQKSNEIAVSTLVLSTFEKYGYRDDYEKEALTIQSAEDLIGKTLRLGSSHYTICGIVDPGIDMSRYEQLDEGLDDDAELSEQLIYMALSTEKDYAVNYSLLGLGIVSEGSFNRIVTENSGTLDFEITTGEYYFYKDYEYGCTSLDAVAGQKIVWLDGKQRDTLAENEIIMSASSYMNGIYHASYVPDELNFDWLYQESGNYQAITNLNLTLTYWPDSNAPIMIGPDGVMNESSSEPQSVTVKIVGILPDNYETPYVFSDALMQKLARNATPVIYQTLSAMPEGTSAVERLVQLSAQELDGNFYDPYDMGREFTSYRFDLQNPVSFELRNLHEIFLTLRVVFMWIGIAFVVFASLLFSNFIATSISYKKREIGILRAIGSRSNDVFRIFFAESFIIAMINFVLSLTGVTVICAIINGVVRNEVGLLLTILNVGLRQVGLLFGICLIVAAAASFLPVRKIAAKRPIDAIRDR